MAELEVGALVLDTGELLDMMAAAVETKLLEMDEWAELLEVLGRLRGIVHLEFVVGVSGVTQNMVLIYRSNLSEIK